MVYKTVLAHCNDKSRIHRLIGAAVEVCTEFGAHLTGVSVAPPIVVIPAGVPGTPDTIVLDENSKTYCQDNPEMKAAFEAAAHAHNLATEWCEADAASATVADVVLQHGRAADLIVCSQTDPKWSGSAKLDIADRLLLESGRPVLIIPNEGPQQAIGTRILVAWNARREAARAVFDALPFLRRATEVKVIWVNPQSAGELAQDDPAADICNALTRHGVKCETIEAVQPNTNVGRTLLRHGIGADLLVMGCYGHSRLREFVFGGATEYVLRHMTIPVLMSH
jgi:nucleotide-binding universal stress UspA family protein